MEESSIKNDIYEKLNNTELTEKLELIIKDHSIPHSINNNGTFINISVLEKNILLILNNYLMNETKKNTEEDIIEENDTIFDSIEPKEDIIKKKKSNKNIKLTSLQQTIISFSL